MTEIVTQVDDERVEVISVYRGTSRDALILVREVAHRCKALDLRSCELTINTQELKLHVKARR
jgi:hypothetical protein